MRDYESYQHYVGLCEQEAGGSSDGPKRRRTYIYREREKAEQRLIDDYFGDDEYEPKYPEEKFRRMYRMSSRLFNKILNDILSYDVQPLPEYFSYFRSRLDATGRNSIGSILKCTSTIRQMTYGTSPDALDEYLQIAELIPKRQKTKKEVYDEITSKSNFFKAEKARDKEENDDLIKNPDEHFTTIPSSLAAQPKQLNVVKNATGNSTKAVNFRKASSSQKMAFFYVLGSFQEAVRSKKKDIMLYLDEL
ncbi:retrovirus-related pol polyprotein from transposon TNT 1-94 [Tanacetum coccineum]